jgi:hypothetical protein
MTGQELQAFLAALAPPSSSGDAATPSGSSPQARQHAASCRAVHAARRTAGGHLYQHAHATS